MRLFGSSSRLGIDIGTAAIKIMELSKDGGRFTLKNYGMFELKKGLADEKGKQNILQLPDQEIIWGIKEVLKKSKIKASDVIASIPSFSTFSTVLEMPYLSQEELAQAIPFEARKYVPVPMDQIVLDWSIIDVPNQQTVVGKPVMVEIFIAAVPKDETARYQSIMKGSGLNLVALELENSALIRALLGNDLSATAIVNIGGRSTSIVVVSKGYERIGHNYEVGGFQITKTISDSLNVNLQKAEELKRQLGLNPKDENIIMKAMSSLVDMMVFETKKTITNYEETKNQKIGKILLTGGMTNMPHFAEYFKNKIEREVLIGNALSRVVYPAGLSSIVPELASTFSVAAGLAMREI